GQTGGTPAPQAGGTPALPVRTLLEDPNGVIRDPDVSHDGQRILFAWKKSDRQDDYHLYEMDVASGQSRQLTSGLGYADYEGKYLPNGDIIFSSTRCVQTVDCFTTEVSNLYTCDKDGKLLHRLGFDQVHTNYPTVLNDGRVVYTRWEYNDRGQIFVQGLMQMNPDGTGQTEFYGMNSWFPTTLMHSRAIPDSNKVISVAGGHHTRQTGKLVIVDNRLGFEENSGVQLIAPVRKTEAVHVDGYGQDGELFQYPYAISEKEYLVTYTPYGWARQPVLFGIYFMDSDGHRELLACDPKVSCNQPVPLAPRAVQPVRPNSVNYRKTTGTYYMQDVYAGPGLAGVPRGAIKKLRVVALDYRLALIGGNGNGGPAGGAFVATPVSIGNGTWDVKIVLGDATVYEDGSAFFEAPARTPVFFQALDEKGYMVQSMRSWSTLQPGENAACVGCHENKGTTPLPPAKRTYALAAGPQKLLPFYGPARGFSFPKEVQPILDRHCIACHDDRSASRNKEAAFSADLKNAKTLVALEGVWQFTTAAPAAGWEKPEFDAGKWQSGRGGFGTKGTPGGVINTEWKSADIWLRRAVELPAGVDPRQMAFWFSHDEDVDVFVNGVRAVCETGYITAPKAFPLPPAALKAVKPGSNILAVHCLNTAGGQYIDVSLVATGAPQAEPKEGKSFSLLAAETPDNHAKRKWSDAYLALTNAPRGEEARGNQSDLVTWINAQSAPPLQPPYSTGAAKSRLLTLLEQGHYKVKLSREELEKIACWIDLAVPYCGDYLEANTWSPDDMKHHERLLQKRKAQEELESKNIEELLNSHLAEGRK
ncbi:MAG: hypothetical protein ABSE73_23230, partial [Planctomycetota bacterium]